MRSPSKTLFLVLFALTVFGAHADGFIELEAGVAFTGYNDVQIPSDTGTRLSLATDTNSEPSIGLLLDADALVTPFGRAEDVLAALQYRPSDTVSYRLGYRVLEGGSDGGGSVYTFALFHYITAGMTVRF